MESTFAKVLESELEQISNSRKARLNDKGAPTGRAIDMDLMGLSLSGGGVRSATFNLGVLQALARLKLLHRFDYLSTVSGGGYIGTWYLAWLSREKMETVHAALAGRSAAPPPNSGPIHWLRQYSNFLTPKVGLFSADTWVMVSMYLRNLVLNQAVLIATIAAVFLLVRMLQRVDGPVPPLLFFVAVTGVALWYIGRNLRGLADAEDRERSARDYMTQGRVLGTIVAPLVLAAVTAASMVVAQHSFEWAGIFVAIGLAVLTWVTLGSPKEVPKSGSFLPALLASGFSGFLFGLLWLGLVWFFSPGGNVGSRLWWHGITFGTPLVILAFSLVMTVYLGVMGALLPDRHREWWSRVGGWLLIAIVGWLALFGIVIYGPLILHPVASIPTARITAAALWLITSVGGAFLGRSPDTDGRKEPGRMSALIIRIAPIVFVVGLMLIISTALHFGLYYWSGGDVGAAWQAFLTKAPGANGYPEFHWAMMDESSGLAGIGLGFFVTVAVLLGWRVDINEFSMHQFYRNRLVRCYLGASQNERRPHPFTGFDVGDEVPLENFNCDKNPGYSGPYPIINATLNLVGGKQLAWQERKAASFVFTPRHYGFQISSDDNDRKGVVEAYQPPEKIQLGTCMAISGAAVSPNWGYHSSPAMAFLMTMFNVRLGWWLGNPYTYSKAGESGPAFGLAHLIREMLGLTDHTSSFVYLSDGGHFENLGLYELVRRRCRFIVLCDAGQDPLLRFDDLGNAIRKCRTDHKIDIEMDLDDIRIQQQQKHSHWHCAVGKIRYDLVDDNSPSGVLVYLKSSLTGDEDTDLLNFADAETAFPHHSTADQWFNERQFESYRRLGFHVAWTTFSAVPDAKDLHNNADLFRQLAEAWYTPSPESVKEFSRHAVSIDAVFKELRDDPELAFLDRQFYPEWREMMGEAPSEAVLSLPDEPKLLRRGFYFCSSLLQIMENVYVDLNLTQNYNHPDNRGWMNLFHHWSWSAMLRLTWSIAASTYGARFQTFCRHHLNLSSEDGLSVMKVADPSDLAGLANELNVLEIALVKAIQANIRDLDLYVLQLASDIQIGDRTPRFTFGFALVSSPHKLVAFRIQDHVRQMGLGTKGLTKLVEKGVNDLDKTAISQFKSYNVTGNLRDQVETELKAMSSADAVIKMERMFQAALAYRRGFTGI